MPSIAGDSSRHVIIDRREGEYLCFPDVCRMPGGRIICAYQEYDQHAATRRKLLIKTSEDHGHEWSEARTLPVDVSHCPRLSLIHGEVHLLDSNGKCVFFSSDRGDTWKGPDATGVRTNHVVFDRPLPLPDGSLLTTGHEHRGDPLPLLRQAPAQQLLYRSTDRGRTYAPLAPIHEGSDLVLCEASVCLLPDGTLAALMRENAMVFEPMYLSLSRDQGRTWSAPQPTPLVGHRPTLGMTASGKLLATYRDVGPDGGTAAWLGSLDELRGPYMVHGLAPAGTGFDRLGMRVPDDDAPARWALRPMTDPAAATADIECEVMAKTTRGDGAGVHLGLWWRILPDRILAEVPGEEDGTQKSLRVDIPQGRMNTLRLAYAAGTVTLQVNGRTRAEVAVRADRAQARVMAFGSPARNHSGGETLWTRVSQRISEPRLQRNHRWRWQASDGLPHAPKLARVLELDNDRNAHYGDFGYSGWCEIGPGRFFCAYHHGGGDEPDYRPSFSSHVRGAWFSEEDFL